MTGDNQIEQAIRRSHCSHKDSADPTHQCVGMKDHDGFHINGAHEWSATPKYEPETKVVLPKKTPETQARLESAKKFYAENYRAHCKSYYGYDPAESNSFEQRQGDWADPAYRAKYMGFKK